MATDVGAWRVVLPVLRELDRRGEPYRVMLAEPASTIARQDGVEHVALTAATLAQRVDDVLEANPSALLLGTSVQDVVERALVRRIRETGASVPTLGVLDAMLFVERRFGPDFAEFPDLVACPDGATACRLMQAGASESALAVTGNPTLEEIWQTASGGRLGAEPDGSGAEGRGGADLDADRREAGGRGGADLDADQPETGGRGRLGLGLERVETWKPAPTEPALGAGFQHPIPSTDHPNLSPPQHPIPSGAASNLPPPVDILFVSSPVAAMRLRGAEFTIDEREALSDVLDALAALPEIAPAGYRVRVRLHPVQRFEGLPEPPPGIALVPDDDPDRLRSCARARVVVGLSSTLLGEARFLPRSAIAYLPGPFWEQEQVFAPEYGVPLARSVEHLQGLLAQTLREPPDPPPLAGHLGAAGRIADLLHTLTARARR